ncbi:hypothetical protein O0L34_g16084 [Tuta absoluta]|nr:hypothetical protein O0L34_g16084 [Tuta absoluta]
MGILLCCCLIFTGLFGSSGSSQMMTSASKDTMVALNVVPELPPGEKRILKDLSLPLRLAVLNEFTARNSKSPNGKQTLGDQVSGGNRMADIKALILQKIQPNGRRALETDFEDDKMKMKLFRLMYEAVRDSDVKVKRAELIKHTYANSSSFEVGYLLGDITDKFNIMMDICNTLRRLYNEWKPIEHINAYEQISNIAIELSHIVDMVKGVEKRNEVGRPDQSGGYRGQLQINLPPPQNPDYALPNPAGRG